MRTGLSLQQTQHICGHLWYRYYVTVNILVMAATVKLSKWLLQVSYKECLVKYEKCTDYRHWWWLKAFVPFDQVETKLGWQGKVSEHILSML